ncbi:MAG: GNAT family N-acetyltransferase [Anaerolineaceae bacterium]
MITYNYEPENNRVAAYLEDGTEVGKLTYNVIGDVWDADHTFVDADHRGGPIASEMLKLLVEKARELGKAIHPTCPYVAKTVDRTPEYHDVLRREL